MLAIYRAITSLILFLLVYNITIGQTGKDDGICLKPQVPAEFIFGLEEMNEFISNNLIVPRDARFYGINGEVKLQFLIDTAGGVGDIIVVDEYIDLGVALYVKEKYGSENFKGFFSDEGKRVVTLMNGLFVPAKDSGKVVCSPQEIMLKFRTRQYDENKRQERKVKANQSSEFITWNFGMFTREELDYSRIRYDYGVAKMQENKTLIACKYFEESIRINPLSIDALYNLGVSYIKLGRVDDACRVWEKASGLGDAEAGSLFNQFCTDRN